MESAGGPGHPIIWLYAAFIGVVLIGMLVVAKIGPKTPLYISIPIAIPAWVYCVWLLGFHSERLAHIR